MNNDKIQNQTYVKTVKRPAHPEIILADAYYNEPELIDVYIANISNKKHTSNIVKKLQTLYPLGSLQHLKRVKLSNGSLQVVLFKASDIPNCNSSKNEIPLNIDIATIEGLGDPYPFKVPALPALTRKQYEEASKYWPVNFHEDKEIACLLSDTYFTGTQLEVIGTLMVEAIRMAKKGAEKDETPIGAVIVDPETNVIIAKAFDLRKTCHPLQHAVMVAIDLVAHSQGGGMWNLTDSNLYFSKTVEEANTQDKTGPYLCTGYDLFVTQEPCVMCSMALVHSRISRVFYGSSQESGALGSQYKIHCQTGLNHHYTVFKNVMSQETDRLYCNGR